MGDPFVHDTPKPLNRVQMRGIRWQKVQLNLAIWAIQPWLKNLGMVIAGIVQIDMDYTHVGIVPFQFFQHLPSSLCIDFFGFNKGEVEGFQIDRP